MCVCVFVLYIHGIFLEGYKETVNNGYLTSERDWWWGDLHFIMYFFSLFDFLKISTCIYSLIKRQNDFKDWEQKL